MTRKMSPERKRKENIRRRDRKMYEKRYVCALCGEISATQLHHFHYSDVYDPRALIEVCPDCHKIMDAVTKDAKNVVKQDSISVSWTVF